MTMEDRSVPVALNDGMGGTERKRLIEVPELASMYIECLGPMGQVLGRATGFTVRGREGVPYLVTNRHVVTGRNSLDADKPIRDSDGGEVIPPSALRVALPSAERLGVWKPCIYDLGDSEYKPTWLEHPDLGWKVDVIALPIHVDEEIFGLPPVPMTPSPAQLRIATRVFVVGFPVGFNPFTAPGAIGVWTGATMAWQPELDWQDLPVMLLDGRTREGQSGSPTWFVADEFTGYLASDGSVKNGPVHGLIGIYGGRIASDSDIGYVWKRKALEAILERGAHPDKPTVSPLDDSVSYDRLLDPVAIQRDKDEAVRAAREAKGTAAEEAKRAAVDEVKRVASGEARKAATKEVRRLLAKDNATATRDASAHGEPDQSK
jgi:Trypsin-like peptidase domain